ELDSMLARLETAAGRHFGVNDVAAAEAAAERADIAPSKRIDISAPVPASVKEAAQARLAETASQKPLYWHPPEVKVIDISPTAVSVEVHASVLYRDVLARKNTFFREALGLLHPAAKPA
ncbi:MAG: hypothetical protein ACYCQK_10175, partial [Acidiferrobacteraceae bacterium]